jgi:hypothetical protein
VLNVFQVPPREGLSRLVEAVPAATTGYKLILQQLLLLLQHGMLCLTLTDGNGMTGVLGAPKLGA